MPNYGVAPHCGTFRLMVSEKQIGERGTPAFMGRRLQHLDFKATTELVFDPTNEHEQAGMTLVNNGQHFDVLVKNAGDKRVVFVELQFGKITYKSKEFVLEPGPVNLRVSGQKTSFTFSFSQEEKYVDIETVDSRFLSTETVGWFTGVYVGLYATSKGEASEGYAEYDYFEYAGK